MKINLFFGILTLLTTTAAAQAFKSDANLKYSFPFLKEQSPSNNIVTRFSCGILEYQLQTFCIEFDFKIMGHAKSVRPDSIILIAGNNKELILKYSYRDTIHTTNNSSRQVAIVHFLKPEAYDFLRNNLIQAIVVVVDNNPSYINLSRKNRTRLREMINSN